MSSVYRVAICPHCKKSFIKKNIASSHCSVECGGAWSRRKRQFKEAKRRVSLTPEQARKAAHLRVKMDERYAILMDVMNRLKLDSGCVDCGYREHPTALHFDHIKGQKVKDVSKFWSLEAALAEVEKCVVRCANCHMIKTYEWKQSLKKERIARDLTILNSART